MTPLRGNRRGLGQPRLHKIVLTIVTALVTIGLADACAATSTTPNSTTVALGTSASPTQSPSPDQSSGSADVVVPTTAVSSPGSASAAPVVHTSSASQPSTRRTTQAPVTHKSTPATVSLCGAPSNPDGYTYCGTGSLIYSPDSNVCDYFNCIDNFSNGTGYMVECRDGTVSMSGGKRGACSYHGGEERPVHKV